MGELAVVSLHDGTSRVFDSADEMARTLDADTYDVITGSVYMELHKFAPSYRRSNVLAWQAKLRVGAEHASNFAISERLACCVDNELGWGAIPHPERFFSIQPHELTDGQWMAFRAARWVHVERRLEQHRLRTGK